MKKIVGILSAAAVLAASVFAADVSAKVKLDGSLFNLKDDKSINALTIQHNSDESWNPVIAMSVNGDVAGAETSIYMGTYGKNGAWNNAYAMGIKTFKIWFSPLDGLKVNLGNVGTNLNQESINYSETDSGVDSEGFGISYNKDAIGIDLILAPGWGNNWFSKADGQDATVAETYFKFQYNGGDIGTINAMFDAKDTFKTLKFGAGYKNTFSGITVFENVLGYVGNEKFTKIRSETFASGNVDAFSWAVWLPVDINLGDKVTVGVGTIAKATYNAGPCSIYLYLETADWLADNLAKGSAITVKPGVTGNVGTMSYEVAVETKINDPFSLSVPVSFTVNF
ncbi:MAG: hypothetical protein SO161_03410 [Treponema sp.]|nr:hypothetical protein [Treponema sp.]